MSFLEEVDVLRVKVKAWRDDELTILQNKLKEVTGRLDTVEIEYAKLRIENSELKTSFANLEAKYKDLEIQSSTSGVKGLN
jgi:predicted nuclease with TOPRIM domain